MVVEQRAEAAGRGTQAAAQQFPLRACSCASSPTRCGQSSRERPAQPRVLRRCRLRPLCSQCTAQGPADFPDAVLSVLTFVHAMAGDPAAIFGPLVLNLQHSFDQVLHQMKQKCLDAVQALEMRIEREGALHRDEIATLRKERDDAIDACKAAQLAATEAAQQHALEREDWKHRLEDADEQIMQASLEAEEATNALEKLQEACACGNKDNAPRTAHKRQYPGHSSPRPQPSRRQSPGLPSRASSTRAPLILPLKHTFAFVLGGTPPIKEEEADGPPPAKRRCTVSPPTPRRTPERSAPVGHASAFSPSHETLDDPWDEESSADELLLETPPLQQQGLHSPTTAAGPSSARRGALRPGHSRSQRRPVESDGRQRSGRPAPQRQNYPPEDESTLERSRKLIEQRHPQSTFLWPGTA